MAIRIAEAAGSADREALASDIYAREFLQARPLLSAIDPDLPPAVLLIDELDRADEPFEAFLLEVLADFQITVPEYGTMQRRTPPVVVLTSNRTREVHDAIRRRCLSTGSITPMPGASGRSWRARRRACRRGCRPRSSASCSGCAARTCSSCPASPRRSTGRRR